jgi:hypothetical protein
MKDAILMILGCVVPLLLLFLMPALGLNDSLTLIIWFVLMCGTLVYMTRGHSQRGDENNEQGHKHN